MLQTKTEDLASNTDISGKNKIVKNIAKMHCLKFENKFVLQGV